jgi:hypothetical protein
MAGDDNTVSTPSFTRPNRLNTSAVPDCPKQDPTPKDVTLYLTIDLGLSGQEPLTAVYVPDRTKLGGTVDIILYLHGHKEAFQKAGRSISIEEHLKLTRGNGTLYYPLREEIAKSTKKQFVFVAPTLGDHSEGGTLIDKNSGAGDPVDFLNQVINGIQKHLNLPILMQYGDLVLAAHSGGGVAMRQLANHAAIKSSVKEAWCFDCLYSGSTDSDFWSKWATPDHRLFVHSTGDFDMIISDPTKVVASDELKADGKYHRHVMGTLRESEAIKSATASRSNVQVEIKARTVDHNSSPGTWIKDLIDQSPVLV